MSRLGSFLVQEGILTSSDRQMIQRESAMSHGSFARSILALGLLDEDELSALFAAKTAFRRVSKDILAEMDYGVSNIAPTHILAWLEVLPLSETDGALTVAMVDPTDQDAINQMAFFTGRRIRPVIATQTEVLRGLREIGATLTLAESRFETFLKTHGRMSKTNQSKPPAAVARRHDVEDDFSSHDMSFGSNKFNSGAEPLLTDDMPTEETLSESEEVFDASPAAQSVKESKPAEPVAVAAVPSMSKTSSVEPEVVGASLDDRGLAASAPDEPVSADDMDLYMDLPPELQDDGDSSLDAASAVSGSGGDTPAPDANNLSGLEVDVDVDLADSIQDADMPTVATPALEVSGSLDNMDVDVNMDFTGGDGTTEESVDLKSDLADEIKIQPELDSADDSTAASIAGIGLDDIGFSPDGTTSGLNPAGAEMEAVDFEQSGEADLGGAVASEEAISSDEPQSAASDNADLATIADDMQEIPLAAEMESSSTEADFESEMAANDSELAATPLDADLPVTLMEGELDSLNADMTDSLGSNADFKDESGDRSITEPGIDAGLGLGGNEPSLDLTDIDEKLSFDKTPAIGDLSDESGSAKSGSPKVAAALANAETVSQSGELASAVHPGIAVLNRALIQVQMSADAARAFSKVADVAGKVGIDSGSVVILKADQLIPGVMWQKSAGKLGHISDVPAGIDAGMLRSVATKSDNNDSWISIDQALGSAGAVIQKAWPDAAQSPNMALLMKRGDVIILSLASFAGTSDHEGLRQSFGDVIRAAGSKLGA